MGMTMLRRSRGSHDCERGVGTAGHCLREVQIPLETPHGSSGQTGKDSALFVALLLPKANCSLLAVEGRGLFPALSKAQRPPEGGVRSVSGNPPTKLMPGKREEG